MKYEYNITLIECLYSIVMLFVLSGIRGRTWCTSHQWHVKAHTYTQHCICCWNDAKVQGRVKH